jgi:DivIVA domain-containing protein
MDETGVEPPEALPAGPGRRPHHVGREIRDVHFPTVVRGYDRRAVDRYVETVNRVIAELEVSGSPEAAVRHALDRVGAQTSGILQRARQTAEEITVTSRAEAEETTARARAEAEEIVAEARAEAGQIVARADREAVERLQREEHELEMLGKQAEAARAEAEDTTTRARVEAEAIVAEATAGAERIVARADTEAGELLERAKEELEVLRAEAEARMRELRSDTEVIEKDRRKLLADVRGLATRLEELASAGAERFPAEKSAEPAQTGTVEPKAAAQPEPTEGEATNAGLERPSPGAGPSGGRNRSGRRRTTSVDRR